MNLPSRKTEHKALPVNFTLEELLTEMERFGKPRVGKYGTGWHSNIEVSITPVGAQFEIRSDFGLPTPLAAARECYDRLIAAMKELAQK